MPEQIYTFTDEELARMFKSGEMRVLTTPEENAQKTSHEKALEKAKALFGEDFENVFTLQCGGKTLEQLLKELLGQGFYLSTHAEKLLRSCSAENFLKDQIFELIKLKVSDLGFKTGVCLDRIYEKAKELGLGFCPIEIAPYLRLEDKDQPLDEFYVIAMEPIKSPARILYLDRTSRCLYLQTTFADPRIIWDIEDAFIFNLS